METAHKYELILFDLDGTLTDPKPGITRAVQYALARYDISVADLDSLTPFIGPPLHHSFARYYGFDARQAREAVTFYREYFTDTGIYENSVYPGIPQLLERLSTAERRLIVATSKPTIYAQRIIEHFQMHAYFTDVVGSDLNLTRTDKAEIIADILTAYPDVAREAIVMIGDREHDIIGARAHDLDAIGVTYGYGSLAELQAAGATSIAGSVTELASLLI
ncbi:MAG TPA: HAD family hydrolase [Ktedonobacterales bacterium]